MAGRRSFGGDREDRDYLALALRFLARSDKTAARIEEYLRGKGAGAQQCRSVVRELERRGYLNDQAFATRWAGAQLARRPMGRERLKAELLRRGFSDAVTETALRKAFGDRSEADLASLALEKRSGGRRSGQNVRFLRQRGFDDETIEDVTGINLDAAAEE